MVKEDFPEYYFKFHSFGEHINETLVKLLDHQVYTPQITQLNDPFEGLWYENNLDAIYPDGDKELRNSLERRRVYCLCSNDSEEFPYTPESITMWSHYADSHKGFCIMFSKAILDMENQEVEYSPRKIEYSDSMAEKTSNKNQDKLILCKKSEVWKTEKEVRLCFRDKDSEGKTHLYRSIPERSVLAIFAGCRISELNDLMLAGLCQKLGCKYIRLKPSTQKFGFEEII